MPSPASISVPQLSRLIGCPTSPMIIDVRIDEDFDADPRLIPTASRHNFSDIGALAPRCQGQHVVVVCHRGLKLSQGAAAILRAQGVRAEALEGGADGWRAAGEPLIPVSSLPAPGPNGHSRWVTRHRPKIDRIACPWLIRRFVDPSAEFLFVAPSEVLPVAARFDATPFDVEDVFWSHRADRCTFDAFLEELGLETEALTRLAAVIRGADTNRHDLAPEAAGLLAVSVGLSRMHRDDLEQLGAGMHVYDALYRWARDGFEEGHDWPSSRTS